MAGDTPYFFVGIGGSGMLPLALILKGRGFTVEGSDRSLDQGRTRAKFDYLRAQGIRLFAQDGTGVTRSDQIVVASAAVEESVPDIAAARRAGARLMRRADLLAELFNAARDSIAVGGTSGKSTTAGMIGWILKAVKLDPTIMNGAVMKNFVTADALFASAAVGRPDLFVAEVDESDGTIALYKPRIAVLNNIAHDHKSMEELRTLFADFLGKAERAVVNLDNAEAAALAAKLPPQRLISYSLSNPRAALRAEDIQPAQDGIAFVVHERATETLVRVRLKAPGRHNVSNALAALGAARALGVPLAAAAEALEGFAGVKRRMEIVGTKAGVTVIDDFAHNPDKITATLETLHAFPGRLLVMFQPHGFGPLKLMKQGFIDMFAAQLAPDDVLLMPEPVYFGGTVDRSVSSRDITDAVAARGRKAEAWPDRTACGDRLLSLARQGDRIVVMGARDDTLSEFAGQLLERLG